MHILTIIDCGEHFFTQFCKLVVRFYVVWLVTLSDLAVRVDNKDFTKGHLDIQITDSICLTVTKATVKRCLVPGE